MKSRSLTMLVALALAVFGAASAQQGDEQGMPTIQITSPTDGENVTGPDVEVTVSVENFTLTENASTPPSPTEGYYELYLDGVLVDQSTETTYTLENLTTNATYELTVQLVSHAGTPVPGDGSMDMVTFNVTEEEGIEEVLPENGVPGFGLFAGVGAMAVAVATMGLFRRRGG